MPKFLAESCIGKTSNSKRDSCNKSYALWVLRPGDTLLSITGDPYDTIRSTIGINDKWRRFRLSKGL